MILIGRGLDLRRFVEKKRGSGIRGSVEECLKGKEAAPWSDGEESPSLCGFQGARLPHGPRTASQLRGPISYGIGNRWSEENLLPRDAGADLNKVSREAIGRTDG